VLAPGIAAVNLKGLCPPPVNALKPGQSALFDHLFNHAPTADLLPAAVQAVDGALPVLVDGGIRRGTDGL
jgi:isopentenyl diphosphate isomerase/L-lactate dehydrogenase-like FMN-dependent dehydrogenase